MLDFEKNPTPYLEAAKIVASCKKDRIPTVMAILKQGGLEFELDDSLVELLNSDENVIKYRKKVKMPIQSWIPSSDPYVIQLRRAYIQGVSFSNICKKTGANRSALYAYITGKRAKSPKTDSVNAKVSDYLHSIGID